jgi:DNA-binding NarL/FixJ family response regulator
MFDYGMRPADDAPMTIRVLVVDDYKDWRDQVRSLLRARPEWQIICEVSDGSGAVQKGEELKPDVILLDIGLPGMNGIDAALRIRQLSPNSKIIFLSMETSLDVVQAALSTGAEGYVRKTDAHGDLLPAIDTVLRGGQFLSNSLKGYRRKDASEKKALHRHEVQFYSEDAVILNSFTRFISAALKAGDVAIVVATESHRNSLAEKLKAQGLDIDAAIRQGTYIPLDVVKTLSTFMVNDMPDSHRFFEFVGDLIRSAAKAGQRDHPRVVACGECAPLLWAEGKADAAIRLEQLCDQLVTTHELDVLCGYALSSFHGEEDESVFQSICEEHSAVYSQEDR